MTDTITSDDDFRALASWEPVQRHWGWLLGLGILWMVIGALALIVPFAASLATTLLIGGLLTVGGVFQIIHAFSCRGWSGFGLHMAGGLLATLFGVVLLAFPISGVLGLTLTLSALFLVHGASGSIPPGSIAASAPGAGWR